MSAFYVRRHGVGGYPFFFHNLSFLFFFFLKVKIKRTSGFDFLKCFRIKLPKFSELKILLFRPSQKSLIEPMGFQKLMGKEATVL
jgi:hypothetical protein